MFITLFKKINSILFPIYCIFCGEQTKNTQMICAVCQLKLPILSHSCIRCAEILPLTQQKICGACLKNPPAFDCTYALFRYETPIIKLITDLKFNQHLYYAVVLGELLKHKILNEWYLNQSLPQLLIPMPLHKKRLQSRGFNQTIEITKSLSKLLPIDTNGVHRVKHTRLQSHLNKEQRAKNVANAFILNKNYTGLSVAIFDDVMTTGQTINSLSKTLKQNGVKRIDVWCCARAMFIMSPFD